VFGSDERLGFDETAEMSVLRLVIDIDFVKGEMTNK